MSKNLTIGYIENIGPLKLPISHQLKSNYKKVCLDCGIKITALNNSGWEGFTEDGVTTQPLCQSCNIKRNQISAKDLN